MKKIFSLLIIILSFVSCDMFYVDVGEFIDSLEQRNPATNPSTPTIPSAGIFEFEDDGAGGFILKSGTVDGSITDIVIPSTYNGSPVTGIKSSAFQGNTDITSVVIPDNITSIGRSAFSGCTGLTSVRITDKVTTIEERAFEDCPNITYVYTNYTKGLVLGSAYPVGANPFPSGWKYDDFPISNEDFLNAMWVSPTSSGGYFFQINNSGTGYVLVKVDVDSSVIPSTHNGKPVTGIGEGVFRNKTSITSISIPDSVTSIGSSAFNGCTGLTSVVIPENVTSIGSFAFYGCTGIMSVTIPDEVITISQYAFDGCSALTTVYTNFTKLQMGAFVQPWGVKPFPSTWVQTYNGSSTNTEFFDATWVELTP